MKYIRIYCFLFAVVILLCGSACNFRSECKINFFAMDTVMTINAYGSKSEIAVESAENKINSLDAQLSVQNENSEIYKLNSKKAMNVSPDTLVLLKRANEINSLTEGAFDITTEPLSYLWGFYSGLENQVPSQDDIDNVLKSVGAEHIKIDNNLVTLDKNTSIDLGGIAKGYASATAAQILEENGISSALISLGGNVRVVGSKPDGSEWKVAIADPDENSEQMGVLSVKDAAVVTSGSYQRYFEENGKIYHHIIDTQTGYPADSHLKSVTVVSEDDTLADALSTALFVMGVEKSSSLYRENNSLFGAVFITDNNEILITENLEDKFSSQYDYEVIEI